MVPDVDTSAKCRTKHVFAAIRRSNCTYNIIKKKMLQPNHQHEVFRLLGYVNLLISLRCRTEQDAAQPYYTMLAVATCPAREHTQYEERCVQ